MWLADDLWCPLSARKQSIRRVQTRGFSILPLNLSAYLSRRSKLQASGSPSSLTNLNGSLADSMEDTFMKASLCSPEKLTSQAATLQTYKYSEKNSRAEGKPETSFFFYFQVKASADKIGIIGSILVILLAAVPQMLHADHLDRLIFGRVGPDEKTNDPVDVYNAGIFNVCFVLFPNFDDAF